MIRIQIQPCPPVERGDGRDPGAPAARPLLDTPVDSLLGIRRAVPDAAPDPVGAAPAVVFPAVAALAVHALCDACQVAVVDSTTGTTHRHRFARPADAPSPRRAGPTPAARHHPGSRRTTVVTVSIRVADGERGASGFRADVTATWGPDRPATATRVGLLCWIVATAALTSTGVAGRRQLPTSESHPVRRIVEGRWHVGVATGIWMARRNLNALQARRQLDTIAARTGLRLTEIASVIAAEQGV